MAKVFKNPLYHYYSFICPGCNNTHRFDSRWQFNGNIHSPTFTPSLFVMPDHPEHRCHSFVTDGKIQFLGDSHHHLKGTTVELPEIDPTDFGY